MFCKSRLSLFFAGIALSTLASTQTVENLRPQIFQPDNPTFVVGTLNDTEDKKPYTTVNNAADLESFKAAKSSDDVATLNRIIQRFDDRQNDSPIQDINDLELAVEIRAFTHRFNAAATLNQQLIDATSPRTARHAQARLRAINLAIAEGQYTQVASHCNALPRNLEASWLKLCSLFSQSLDSKQTTNTITAIYREMAELDGYDASDWQERLLAELALRLRQPQLALQHCSVLTKANSNIETLRFCAEVAIKAQAYDWALETLRPLRNSIPVAHLKLQWLDAVQPQESPFVEQTQQLHLLLQQEYLLLQKGLSQHHREVAQYLLRQQRYQAAHRVALLNWQQQHFLEDALLLARTNRHEGNGSNDFLASLPFDLRRSEP